MKIDHINRGSDYQITGIELCDLISIAYELENARICPPERRRALASQIRAILGQALPVGRRKPTGGADRETVGTRAKPKARHNGNTY